MNQFTLHGTRSESRGVRTRQSSSTAERNQTAMEELMNALSHGVGFMLAVVSLPVLVYSASQRGSAAPVVGASLFAGTMIVLYLISTLYHALPAGRTKSVFNRLDHAAIYLFIAGSYMPFVLGVLRGPWGWALFGAVWSAAALGVTAKLFNRLRQSALLSRTEKQWPQPCRQRRRRRARPGHSQTYADTTAQLQPRPPSPSRRTSRSTKAEVRGCKIS